MFSFQFISESELFSSDLRFKICEDGGKGIYKADVPMKQEEALERLKAKLRLLRMTYAEKLREKVAKHHEQDEDAEHHLAVAIYIATYFDANKSSRRYYS